MIYSEHSNAVDTARVAASSSHSIKKQQRLQQSYNSNNNSDSKRNLIFSLFVSGRNPENSTICLVPGASRIFLSPEHGQGNQEH